MTVTIDVDLEKLRYSLVGDGYCLKEVVKMTSEELIAVLERRVRSYIDVQFYESKKMNLLGDYMFRG